jgi:hypothetical protein
MKVGRNVMIAAHRNSIRGILKIVDGINTTDIQMVPPIETAPSRPRHRANYESTPFNPCKLIEYPAKDL